MAKYNLMDNQRPDQFDRYFDEEDENQEQAPPKLEEELVEEKTDQVDEKQDFFDESLFTEDTGEEPTSEPSTDIDLDITTEEKSEQIDQKIEEPVEETIEEDEIEKPAPKKELSPEDYEDSKMQKLNIKPLLIGAFVFIFLVAVVFVLFNYVFTSGEEEQIVEEKLKVVPQEKVISEAEKKKISFLKNINAEKKSRLSNFSNISDLQIKGVSYSSVLLYGNSFSFEIFGASREDIAKFNLNLKKANAIEKFKIVNTSTRPGSKGGVFALYKSESSSSPGKSTASGDPKIDANIQELIKNIASRNNLTLKNDRSVTRKSANQFDKIRKEYIYHGSQTNCTNFLNNLAGSNNNFNVHKISLQPTNQHNFSKNKFQLLIVLDFYV